MSNYFEKLKQKMNKDENSPAENKQGGSPVNSPPIEKVDTTKSNTAVKPQENNKQAPLIITGKENQKNKFFISQSIIKEITNQHGDFNVCCPRQVNERFITRNYRYVSKPMMEGVYGETMLLGAGAKGQKVIDLPRHKKNGEKLTAQKNIDEQSLRFPLWCTKKGISVIPGYNVQLPIVKRLDAKSDKRLFATELDIFPSPFFVDGEYKLSVIDVKFAADINQKFGNFCWGAPEFVDHIQADSVYWILQDFDMELNIKYNPEKEEIYRAIFDNGPIRNIIDNVDFIFVYFIIGYKKQPLAEQVKYLQRGYKDPSGSLIRQQEFKERVRKTIAQLNEWSAKEWPAEDGNLCDKCPVNKQNGGYCTQAPHVKTV